MSELTVEDRVLIRERYDRMVWALNNGDPDGATACFTSDAEVIRFDGSISRAAETATAAKAWPSDPVASTRQHHITTFLVDPDEGGHPERRRVRFYFLVTEVANPPEIANRWSCNSDDVVERVDGEWLIQHRKITLNHMDTA